MAKEIDNDQFGQIVADNVGPGDFSLRIERLRTEFGNGFFNVIERSAKNGLDLVERDKDLIRRS